MTLQLAIANKAYSSWSQRPWMLMKHFGVPFEEFVIPLRQSDTRARILAFSPSGKCPCLKDGDIVVWESLAIVEYLAERFPDLPIWPRDRAARALARALSNEMHAGFGGLRQGYPTQFQRPRRAISLSDEVAAEVARIEAAWAGARETFGAGGPFLFGAFSAADAMFAPVVNRFDTYDISVGPATRAYMAAIQDLPSWKAWIAEGKAEPWRIDEYEAV